MNALRPFDFKGNKVRILMDKTDQPWFVAKDVCEVLGIRNHNDAVNRLDEDGVGIADLTDSLGRIQRAKTVNESGLYELIFQSRVGEAQSFKRWVTHEVLPSIRRHGGYMAGQDSMTPEQMVEASMKWLRSRIAEQERQLEAQAPKVLFADAVTASNRSILIGELAKILNQNGVGTGQQRLFRTLREQGFLMKKNGIANMPTQKAMNLKLFEIKETSITHADGHVSVSFTTKVTPKGQSYFLNRFLKAKALS